MKEVVIGLLKKSLSELKVDLKKDQISNLVEVPPSSEMGDYAFPCFALAEQLKMNPHEAALELREHIHDFPETDFEDVAVNGPYVNFFVNRKSLARQVVWDAITHKKDYGKTDLGNKRKVVVEFSSPNIAKPFGIGHLRSTIIGNSLANIFDFEGYKAIRINYLGDWGTQFGRLLYGYKKFGKEKMLEKDPIKHLFDIYVKVSAKKYEKSAREYFKKLEDGDKGMLLLWKLFRNLSVKEFKRVYGILGINFDAYDGESMYNKKSKEIIEELKSKEIIKRSKGAMIVDLEKEGLGTAVIEKADGTTLYATRDIAAAIDRYKKYGFEKMLYDVGTEQKLYFMQMFRILGMMGNSWAKNCVHVDHGLYLDKDGKKFSSRKGKTVLLQDVLDETISLAKEEIKKRDKKLPNKILSERALRIAIAAIFYGDLKNGRTNNITFDIKKFVSFDGNTGPYILYSYARASSILKKSDIKSKFEVNELEEKEINLVKKLSEFQETVANACKSLNPSLIANYSYQLAQTFNEFYNECPVIGSAQETFRLALVESFRQVIKNSLALLGIKVIEKM